MKTQKKIVNWSMLRKKVNQHRERGEKVVFTNGCFDILHYGHVSYLEKAKGKGRVLVVGLNSDESVRKIKGPQRPVNNEVQRAAVLAALECVDYVTIFNEDNPYNLINTVKPDILVKGADWKNKKVIGSDMVKSYGGKVELIEYIPNVSTTAIIKTIQQCKK